MIPDRVSRRAVLAGLAASLLPLRAAGAERALFLSGCRLADGRMAAALFDDAGTILCIEPLDARAHGGALSPDRATAVVFARRPGRFAVVMDIAARRRTMAFAPPADRRFAGHGAFSADGRILYAAENDFEAERGVIGLYDATDGYARIGEFPTHGVGPHEVCRLADGETLAVANGGIATHPDFPRMKLNLPTMQPSMVLLRLSDGALLAKAELPAGFHQLSIRHMAETTPRTLWFGAQYEGPKRDLVPLVGTFDDAAGLSLIEAETVYPRLNQYVGSVAASRDGDRVLTTSPRGGVVLEWDARGRTLRAVHAIKDVCGAAPRGPGAFILSAGTGRICDLHRALAEAPVAWDNHITPL